MWLAGRRFIGLGLVLSYRRQGSPDGSGIPTPGRLKRDRRTVHEETRRRHNTEARGGTRRVYVLFATFLTRAPRKEAKRLSRRDWSLASFGGSEDVGRI